MDVLFGFQNMSSTLQLVGCHFGIKPVNWSYEKHHHHLYELICCMDGKAVQEINGSLTELHPGDWILLKPGVTHTVTNASTENYAFFNVHFDLDDLEVRNRLGTASYRIVPASFALKSGLPKHLREIERFMQHSLLSNDQTESSGSVLLSLQLHERLSLQAYVLLIIQEVMLYAETYEPGLERGHDPVSAYEVDVAHATEARLTANFADSPSIAAIAHELNLSRSQLTKIFTKVYGLSPRQYLTRRKWSKAKELLAGTNLTVYAISEQLGFRSVNHFSRQFRRWMRMSPMQYRQSMPTL